MKLEDRRHELRINSLATALKNSKCCIVYTGAGISTAASIPDYRGPEGVWTLANRGIKPKNCDPTQAIPTSCHMALRELYKHGYVNHVLSQNCDGLHLRAGLPQASLSEVHGNMYIEVCTNCEPPRQYIRDFDVTKNTAFRKHQTERKCDVCFHWLRDSIVHFGEVGRLGWPLNWQGVKDRLDRCDMILCLGTSLQILKKYTFLWCKDRPKRKLPKLFIVNLEKTPKDKTAKAKIVGRCDDVMAKVMERLGLNTPRYCRLCDPVLTCYRRNCKSNQSIMDSIVDCKCSAAVHSLGLTPVAPQPITSLVNKTGLKRPGGPPVDTKLKRKRRLKAECDENLSDLSQESSSIEPCRVGCDTWSDERIVLEQLLNAVECNVRVHGNGSQSHGSLDVAMDSPCCSLSLTSECSLEDAKSDSESGANGFEYDGSCLESCHNTVHVRCVAEVVESVHLSYLQIDDIDDEDSLDTCPGWWTHGVAMAHRTTKVKKRGRGRPRKLRN